MVGPGFLASKFIRQNELPPLLEAVDKGEVKLYPLVVAWCPWEQSALEPHQAFNDPKAPLESLADPDQNMWLNKLCLAIGEDMRRAHVVAAKKPTPLKELRDAIVVIQGHLETTRTAFIAQARRRNGLVERMENRLRVTESLEYEQFFFRYYDRMNAEERFEFDQIRAYTEGPLYEGNRAILDTLEKHPRVRDELPILSALKTHLIVWLNKYEKVFAKTKNMCLLYVGVEDGVPFPTGVDQAVSAWLEDNEG